MYYQPQKKSKIFINIMSLLILFIFLIPIAHAPPPPPESRIQFLLPSSEIDYNTTMRSYDLFVSSNKSTDDRFVTLDYVGPGKVYAYGDRIVTSGSSLTYFPELSQYWAYKHFLYLKTGELYVAQVWFFDDWGTFQTRKKELSQYLQIHGQVSKESLDLSDELVISNNSVYSGLKSRQFNVTKYLGKDTSGYFIVHEDSRYPGINCYIIYIGIIGPTDVQDYLNPLTKLFVSISPNLDTGINYELDSSVMKFGQNDIDITPLLVIFMIVIGGGILFWMRRKRK